MADELVLRINDPAPFGRNVSRAQVYNDGSATFPYATNCTLSGTCDPDSLVDQMDYPDMAEPISLDLGANANASDAVELVSRARKCATTTSHLGLRLVQRHHISQNLCLDSQMLGTSFLLHCTFYATNRMEALWRMLPLSRLLLLLLLLDFLHPTLCSVSPPRSAYNSWASFVSGNHDAIR